MRTVPTLIRLTCAVLLLTVMWGSALATETVGAARAAPAFESLMVPSAAMGRDIPVAFLGGGPMRCTSWTPSMPPPTSATG
jgi:S-formylglutathione hydrolase FrmB